MMVCGSDAPGQICRPDAAPIMGRELIATSNSYDRRRPASTSCLTHIQE